MRSGERRDQRAAIFFGALSASIAKKQKIIKKKKQTRHWGKKWNQRAIPTHLDFPAPNEINQWFRPLASDNYRCYNRTNNQLSGVSLSKKDLLLYLSWGVGKSRGVCGVWGTDMKAISSSDLATSWLFSTEFVKLWLWSAEMFGSNNFEFDLKMQPHLHPK